LNRKSVSDYPLVILALLLSAYGIAVVYSAGQTDFPVPYIVGAWKRQLGWFVLSLAAGYVLFRASVRLVEWMTLYLYMLSIFLLVITLIFGSGAGTAASVKGWLTIGGVRIGQPAELAKLTVVLMLARVLAARKEAPKSLLDLWKPALVVGGPWHTTDNHRPTIVRSAKWRRTGLVDYVGTRRGTPVWVECRQARSGGWWNQVTMVWSNLV